MASPKKVLKKIRILTEQVTQDPELNTKNRDANSKTLIMALNVDEPGDYWEKIGEYWKTTEKAPRKSTCGVCVAFDMSPRMDDCMS